MDGQERQEIGKAREELAFELGRTPTDEEVIGFYQERYRDVLRMTKPTCSLHSRNRVTQEELINVVTDDDADKHNTLLRLAIDDLMDSLKPKESLVVRQRFGLDGRGKLTLSEIAGKLNISQEMVRKYELKALMKLKHPRRRVECKGSEGADGGAAASSNPGAAATIRLSTVVTGDGTWRILRSLPVRRGLVDKL